MRPDSDPPSRRYPHRLERWKYQIPWQPVSFTLCVHRQRRVLTRAGIPSIVTKALQETARSNACGLIAYCIMPEHLHVLACVVTDGGDLISFTDEFKQTCGYALSRVGIRSPLWQRRLWDRHVRDSDDLANVVRYLLGNPVRRGLCARPEDWPHARFCGYPWESASPNDRRG